MTPRMSSEIGTGAAVVPAAQQANATPNQATCETVLSTRASTPVPQNNVVTPVPKKKAATPQQVKELLGRRRRRGEGIGEPWSAL